MLNTEFGGMNEVLADLYADTGDKRWLDLSHHFDHRAVLDPLARRQDILAGLHGNTQVPKLLGHLARYVYTGDKTDGTAAEFFWDAVALHHSYATGGHGRDEYFGPPDKLGDRVEGRTDESCNVYNMLKMTRRLFAIHPEMKYAEFEERALVQSRARFNRSGRWPHLLHGSDRSWCAARVSGHVARVHLLRRQWDGEPRAARRWNLLRIRR
jgi:DUF1680 family protein